MLGAIAGDIIGSVYEGHPRKSKNFELFMAASRFTDDTVLTVATADALLHEGDYAAAYRKWARRYPNAGYGGWFAKWVEDEDAGAYNSYGNGAAMRVSPVGWAGTDLNAVLDEARRSAEVTHSHAEGVKGAQAIAGAVFLARRGEDIQAIADWVRSEFDYDLSRSVDELRPGHRFDVTARGTVPVAIRCVMDAMNYEDAVRNAVSLGGDADTLACIAGAIAEPLFGGVPEPICDQVMMRLEDDLIEVVEAFTDRMDQSSRA